MSDKEAPKPLRNHLNVHQIEAGTYRDFMRRVEGQRQAEADTHSPDSTEPITIVEPDTDFKPPTLKKV